VIRGRLLRGDDNNCVIEKVSKTDSMLERMRGLLARPPLQRDEGLLIAPCASVHTFGMGYPIDIVFLDRDWKIIKMVSRLKPFRTAGCARAAMTLELAAGVADDLALATGDYLAWRE